MRLGFEHSYATLPPRFYERVQPAPVTHPQVVVFNRGLAGELRFEPDVDAIERLTRAVEDELHSRVSMREAIRKHEASHPQATAPSTTI